MEGGGAGTRNAGMENSWARSAGALSAWSAIAVSSGRAGMQLAVQLLSARSDRRCRDTRTIISFDREVSDAERVCIRAMRIVVYNVIYFLFL